MACSDWKREQDAARGQWVETRTRKCAEEKDQGYKQCTEERDKGYNKCTEERDKGYNKCTEEKDQGYSKCAQERDDGFNKCCDWWPCSWGCKAVVWVSNIICVAWTWISNIVCVVWTWISNIVCVVWTWISYIVCVAWTWIKNVVCVAWTWLVDKVWAAGTVVSWGACEVLEWVTGQAPLDAPDDTLPDLTGVDFPTNFLWGAATAAYQMEGAIRQSDDPHVNDWHLFTASEAIRGRVYNLAKLGGETDPFELQPANGAVGHSNIETLRQDLDRAKLLGMNAYRFSLEWSWLQPKKSDNDPLTERDFNSEALSYYDAALRAITGMRLKPIVTLNHMTLPKWALTPPEATNVLGFAEPDDAFRSSLRGWENIETAKAFVKFVEFIVKRYKDLVDYWMTVNEPVGTVVGAGYMAGVFPPGFSGAASQAKNAYFNLIKAHVWAYDKIKEFDDVDVDGDGKASMVGFAHAMMYFKMTREGLLTDVKNGAVAGVVAGGVIGAGLGMAVGGPIGALAGVQLGALGGAIVGVAVGTWVHAGNIHAAARNQMKYFYNDHFLDSVVSGNVDVEIQRRPNSRKYQNSEEFFDIAAENWKPKLDFIGLNYYRSVYSFYDQKVALTVGFSGGLFHNDLREKDERHNLLNDLGWEIYPAGMYHLMKEIHDTYKIDDRPIPIMITENGTPEYVDRNRAPHIVAHLQHVLRAIKDGINVLGYLHWSIVDNFEWAANYRASARFGLFTVDRSTELRRHITEGALALQYIIAEGNIGLAAEKFGAITPEGTGITPPSRTSGALWEHRKRPHGESGFTLYLSSLKDGKLIGMIFYHEWWGDLMRRFNERHRWLRLSEIVWNKAENTLRFSHPHEDGTRIYQARTSGGNLIEGTINQHFLDGNRVPDTWSAEKVVASGLWESKSLGWFPFSIWLSRMEGDCGFGTWSRVPERKWIMEPERESIAASRKTSWSGKYLSIPLRGDPWWYPFEEIEANGTITKLLHRGPHLDDKGAGSIRTVEIQSIMGDVMKGTIVILVKDVPTKVEWEAKRAPDNMPF